MRLVLFLSRVGFICNIFFIICVLLQLSGFVTENQAFTTALMTGFLLAAIFNPLLVILYIITLIRRQLSFVPAWLVWCNIVFFLLQIAYVLYLNNFHKQILL